MFAAPASTDELVASRKRRIFQLQRMAYGPQPGDEDLDDEGRKILRTYKEIRAWMRYWATATHG